MSGVSMRFSQWDMHKGSVATGAGVDIFDSSLIQFSKQIGVAPDPNKTQIEQRLMNLIEKDLEKRELEVYKRHGLSS